MGCELCKFASFLRVSLHFYNITSWDSKCSSQFPTSVLPAPNFRGPIPALSWYDADTKSPKKRQELIEWYQEQISQEAVFDFREEMWRYCSMDVTALWRCMDKCCVMFQNWGVGPFQYLTIAAVAFNDMHSNQQIAWLNGVMCTQHMFCKNVLEK